MNFEFMAISAGPVFKINPSISFIANFDPSLRQTLDYVWEKLCKGGEVLMPVKEYFWSRRSGWVIDKYGVSWQLNLTNPEEEPRPRIVPCLLFTDERGKAEEAVKFYLSVFENTRLGRIIRYQEDAGPYRKGDLMFCDFKLAGVWLAALNAGGVHDFKFNEAVSLTVKCKHQNEIDYFWKKLSAVPEAEQCGWLKDRFGVSWQIVPEILDTMMKTKNEEKIGRVTRAFLKMKKFDIAELKKAYEGGDVCLVGSLTSAIFSSVSMLFSMILPSDIV